MSGIDKAKVDAFWQARTAITDPRLATSYRDDGRLAIDAALAHSYGREGMRVLDLGAGTCTLSAELLDVAEEVVAVDKFDGFLESAPSDPRMRTIAADVSGFQLDESFDLILLFGVVNYLPPDDEIGLYAACAAMLAPDGTFIVKHQCGVDAEVVVDSYSDELGAHYNARYPQRDEQVRRLEEHFAVEVLDVYPPELNRWENTHFYAFICTKK